VALTLQQVIEIRSFLLSSHVTLRGDEFMALGALIGALQAEERMLISAAAQSRVTPLPTPVPPPTPEPPAPG